MASKAVQLLKLKQDLNDLTNVHNGLIIAGRNSVIGENLSAAEYVIMNIVKDWVKKEVANMLIDIEKLSNINLI